MAGGIADAVRVNLRGTEVIEQPIGEHVSDQRQCARVVGVQDGLWAVGVDGGTHAFGDRGERLVPCNSDEVIATLATDTLERKLHARIGTPL